MGLSWGCSCCFDSAFNILLIYCFLLAMLSTCSSFNHEFIVGGRNWWSVPNDTCDSLEHWAQGNRFHVGDKLLFLYDPREDSVLLVCEEDYLNCNTSEPRQSFKEGNTSFTLSTSGSFYFISGNCNRCRKSEKLHVIVMATRKIAPSPAPASVAEPAPPTATWGNGSSLSPSPPNPTATTPTVVTSSPAPLPISQAPPPLKWDNRPSPSPLVLNSTATAPTKVISSPAPPPTSVVALAPAIATCGNGSSPSPSPFPSPPNPTKTTPTMVNSTPAPLPASVIAPVQVPSPSKWGNRPSTSPSVANPTATAPTKVISFPVPPPASVAAVPASVPPPLGWDNGSSPSPSVSEPKTMGPLPPPPLGWGNGSSPSPSPSVQQLSLTTARFQLNARMWGEVGGSDMTILVAVVVYMFFM